MANDLEYGQSNPWGLIILKMLVLSVSAGSDQSSQPAAQLLVFASQVLVTSRSLESPAYPNHAVVNCFILETHMIPLALCLPLESDGSKSAERIPMMAMTTSNSMRVKPLRGRDSVFSGAGRHIIRLVAPQSGQTQSPSAL